MLHEWLPLHLLGPVAALLAWALAWVVYKAQPRAAANRRLAILLAVEGWAALALGGANGLEAVFGADLVGAQSVINFVLVMLPGTYLLFLATIESPAARPLRGRAGMVVHLLALVIIPAAWFVAGGYSFAGPPGRWHLLMVWLVFGGMWGLVVSLTALVHSRTKQDRFQMRAYAIAFGLHDLFWTLGALTLTGFVAMPYAIDRLAGWGTPQLTLFFFAPLLAYGMLRYQLLDIDLKVKWTLRRSTLLAVLAAIFFLAKESTEVLLPFDGFVPGLVGAALVTVVALPAWNVAGRFANRLLPDVEDSPAYLEGRKNLIYTMQVEGMLTSGGISSRERHLLQRLQESLGLEEQVAKRLERRVVEAFGTE